MAVEYNILHCKDKDKDIGQWASKAYKSQILFWSASEYNISNYKHKDKYKDKDKDKDKHIEQWAIKA